MKGSIDDEDNGQTSFWTLLLPWDWISSMQVFRNPVGVSGSQAAPVSSPLEVAPNKESR